MILAFKTALAADAEFVRGKADLIANLSLALAEKAIAQAAGDDGDRLNKAQRETLGFKARQRIPARTVEVWIGYSTDEVVRAGAAFETWAVNRFPLLEKRMSLTDCIAWLTRHGYPVPPRSKCRICPYREDAEWRWLRDNEPDSWADAVEIDRLIRDTPGMRAQSYLHKSRLPLDQVNLSSDADRGQGTLMLCDGDCGV